MKKFLQIDRFRSASSDIGLAEILYTFSYLAPKSDEMKESIINLLGFKWKQTEENDATSENVQSSGNFPPPKEEKEDVLPSVEHYKQPDTLSIPTLEPAYSEESQILQPLDFSEIELNNVEALAETQTELLFEKPSYTPLLNQKWFQGIVSSMLTTQTQTKNIDLKLVEKNISTLSPISNLPYLCQSTLNKGVQVVLDVSAAMQFFWRDECELVNSLNRLLDVHKTQVFEFELNINPFPEILWNIGSPEKLQEGIPILLVTNFGATLNIGLSKLRECKDLIQLLQQARIKKCDVALLIPAAEKDFPKDLTELIPFAFIWDKETSPQSVYKIKRL